MRLLDSITDSMNMNLSEFQEVTENRGTWCAAVHGVTLKEMDMTFQLSNNNKSQKKD